MAWTIYDASPGTLGEGLVDLTGGVFQTCYDASNCNTDTANWALDITAPDGSTIMNATPSAVPEASTTVMGAFGILCVVCLLVRRRRRFVQRPKIRI